MYVKTCYRQLTLAWPRKMLGMRGLLLILVLCSQCCFAQIVTVHIVNAKDGKPLSGQAVTVQFLYENPAHASSVLHLETDSNGTAQFHIPEPRPEHLNMKVALDSGHWHCACWVMTDTDAVLRKGVAQNAPSAKSDASTPVPIPGQVLFAARPFTFLERLLYPLVKG